MKTVAIIGASNDHTKYGSKAVRAYQDMGWKVYPVNLKEKTIAGLPVHASILDIDDTIDRVALYVPPEVGIKVIGDIAQKKPAEIFFNPGTESQELLEKTESLGLTPTVACAIVNIGRSPSQYN